jgi:hypothetical protein
MADQAILQAVLRFQHAQMTSPDQPVAPVSVLAQGGTVLLPAPATEPKDMSDGGTETQAQE